jgi:hypothetical protein
LVKIWGEGSTKFAYVWVAFFSLNQIWSLIIS